MIKKTLDYHNLSTRNKKQHKKFLDDIGDAWERLYDLFMEEDEYDKYLYDVSNYMDRPLPYKRL